MNKILYSLLLCSLLVLVLLPHCRNKEKGLTEIEVREIKQAYSVEAINYFYETVFYQDDVGLKDSTSKWEKDIWIGLEGTLWSNDSLYVKNAVEELNDLNLPVKLNMTKDESLVNLKIYFGDNDFLEEKIESHRENRLGAAFITETSSIQFARVSISNNAASYFHINSADSVQYRKAVVLEEITQALGVIGDSWLDYYSIFFEGKKKMINLTEIDKEIIRLLYEPAIPAKLARSDFEAYFKDELYTVNTKEKLIDYVQANQVPKRYLEFIRDNSFQDSTLFKFPKQVFVKLEGDYQDADLEFCKSAVKLLNTASNQLQLEIVEDNTWNELPVITILYNDSLHAPFQAERFLTPGARMITRRLKGKIKLSYENPAINQKEIDKLLFSTLYRILGLDHFREDILAIEEGNQLKFKPDYKEILALLYDPVFPSGFTQKELDEVIVALK